MRGVLLAGGTGSRLMPLTKVTNKHLLPIYNKVLIDFPLETLIKLGCTKVMVTTGGEHFEGIAKYLGSGEDKGVDITYRIQDKPNGIAGALALAEDFIKDSKSFYTILGDNIFLDNHIPVGDDPTHSAIYVQPVKNAYRFGTYIPEKNRIIEKPKGMTDGLCVTGLYKFLPDVFDYIKTLSPSQRGELEITDVNNWYLSRNKMDIFNVKKWYDAGIFDSLLKASNEVRKYNLLKIK